MKHIRLTQFFILSAAFSLAAILLTGAATPTPEESSDQRLVRQAMEILAKYDTNRNNLLDDTEDAVLQADKRKAATEKRLATIARKKAEAEAANTQDAAPGGK
jgi:uncharacterized membrane protein YqiK